MLKSKLYIYLFLISSICSSVELYSPELRTLIEDSNAKGYHSYFINRVLSQHRTKFASMDELLKKSCKKDYIINKNDTENLISFFDQHSNTISCSDDEVVFIIGSIAQWFYIYKNDNSKLTKLLSINNYILPFLSYLNQVCSNDPWLLRYNIKLQLKSIRKNDGMFIKYKQNGIVYNDIVDLMSIKKFSPSLEKKQFIFSYAFTRFGYIEHKYFQKALTGDYHNQFNKETNNLLLKYYKDMIMNGEYEEDFTKLLKDKIKDMQEVLDFVGLKCLIDEKSKPKGK